MSERALLYRYSLQEAVRCGEKALWKESYHENCVCARSIEVSIRENFDGMFLKQDCAKSIISRFGFERVMWVLANTVKEKYQDGRFSADNREWARSFFIPRENHCRDYSVKSHPTVLDGFINQVRKEWQTLGLFGREHCETKGEEADYSGRIVVINPHVLKDEYKTPEDQLFLAAGGFGCNPNARGRKVYGRYIKDGEQTFYQREDIIGILKQEYVPDWAAERVREIKGEMTQQEDASHDLTM